MTEAAVSARGSPLLRRVGLEHEFRVSAANGEAVDFRGLINGLRLGQPNLDPADPNAFRLPSGAAVTCDGREAEIALPPITVAPGFTREVRSRAESERVALAARLAPGFEIEGVSTHISVSVPNGLARDVCRLYAHTFAPQMMLMLDRRDSPGLLVRPRPGRVELGGEYITGGALSAATLFAVGSVLACERALRGHEASMPPSMAVALEPARARFGWYVDRRAFGGDLYAEGRSALLTDIDDRHLTAQELLELAWEAARRALGQLADARERADTASTVTGAVPLPCEGLVQDRAARDHLQALPQSAYGAATQTRRRPMAEIAPVMLTWDVCAFVVLDRPQARTCFAVVPGQQLAGFLHDLDAGHLDRTITAFLRRPPSGSRPASIADIDRPRLYDELGPRLALVAAEYGPDGRPVAPIELLAGRAA